MAFACRIFSYVEERGLHTITFRERNVFGKTFYTDSKATQVTHFVLSRMCAP